MIYVIPYMICDYTLHNEDESVKGFAFYDTFSGLLWDMPYKSDLRHLTTDQRIRYTRHLREKNYQYYRDRPFRRKYEGELMGDSIHIDSYLDINTLDNAILDRLENKYSNVDIDYLYGRVIVWEDADTPIRCGWVDCYDLSIEESIDSFMKECLPFGLHFTLSKNGQRWLTTGLQKGKYDLAPDGECSFFELSFDAISPRNEVMDISLRTATMNETTGTLDVIHWNFGRDINGDGKITILPSSVIGKTVDFKFPDYGPYEINGVPQYTSAQTLETIFQLI